MAMSGEWNMVDNFVGYVGTKPIIDLVTFLSNIVQVTVHCKRHHADFPLRTLSSTFTFDHAPQSVE